MKCSAVLKGNPYRCGMCSPCRTRLKLEWTGRILLESKKHAKNSFLTLTYDDDHLPPDRSVSVREFQLWLKRFRRSLGVSRLRVFYVGEYGDRFGRPHYHAALFGVGSDALSKVHATWKKCDPKRATLTPLLPERAQYLAGYVAKKMTKKDDARLGGRHPEFARMSLQNGGIGAPAVKDIAKPFLTTDVGKDFLCKEGDVPSFLKTHGRSFPLGRYLRGKLREEFKDLFPELSSSVWREGFQDKKFRQDLQDVYARTGAVAAYFEEKNGFYAFGQEREEIVRQMERNLEAKLKLKSRKVRPL